MGKTGKTGKAIATLTSCLTSLEEDMVAHEQAPTRTMSNPVNEEGQSVLTLGTITPAILNKRTSDIKPGGVNSSQYYSTYTRSIRSHRNGSRRGSEISGASLNGIGDMWDASNGMSLFFGVHDSFTRPLNAQCEAREVGSVFLK